MAHITSDAGVGSYGIHPLSGPAARWGQGTLVHVTEGNICGWKEEQGFGLNHRRADGLEGNRKKRKTSD